MLRTVRAVHLAPQDRGAKQALLERVSRLRQDFDEHLALEEEVIFPAVRLLLSEEVQAIIMHELRQRRSPSDRQHNAEHH